jgi:hypothetical protein
LTISAGQNVGNALTLASGRIVVATGGSFTTGAKTATVDSGAQIEYGVSGLLSPSFTIAGTGPDGRGAIVLDDTGTTFSGGITLAADATLGYVGTANGSISLGGTLVGTNTLTLGGAGSS